MRWDEIILYSSPAEGNDNAAQSNKNVTLWRNIKLTQTNQVQVLIPHHPPTHIHVHASSCTRTNSISNGQSTDNDDDDHHTLSSSSQAHAHGQTISNGQSTDNDDDDHHTHSWSSSSLSPLYIFMTTIIVIHTHNHYHLLEHHHTYSSWSSPSVSPILIRLLSNSFNWLCFCFIHLRVCLHECNDVG